mmetsp:Transcript_16516/g.62825  ORF Transcript_16516/g.62825 Transcript_16516/m.62825 type:complete len:245 (+) Transcript_16516:1621-2355(+)
MMAYKKSASCRTLCVRCARFHRLPLPPHPLTLAWIWPLPVQIHHAVLMKLGGASKDPDAARTRPCRVLLLLSRPRRRMVRLVRLAAIERLPASLCVVRRRPKVLDHFSEDFLGLRPCADDPKRLEGRTVVAFAGGMVEVIRLVRHDEERLHIWSQLRDLLAEPLSQSDVRGQQQEERLAAALLPLTLPVSAIERAWIASQRIPQNLLLVISRVRWIRQQNVMLRYSVRFDVCVEVAIFMPKVLL